VRGIRVNIHDPKIVIVVKEENEKNVLVINNVFAKCKLKR